MRRLGLLAFIWGWSFLFIKVAVEGLTPTTVAWARIALGAAVLHLALRHQGLRLPTDRTMLRHFAVVAIYGIGFTYMRRNLIGIPPVMAATGQLSAGAVMLAPVALATSVTDGFALTPTRAGAVFLLGAVGTGLAFLFNYQLVGQVGATRASLVTYLVPVVAITVGVVVLGEPFDWRLLLGAALTIGGIAGVTYGRGAPIPAPSDRPRPTTPATTRSRRAPETGVR